MSNTVIRVENLGKRYRIGAARASYDRLGESLVAAVKAPFRRRRNQDRNRQEFWALRDVSFEVKQGEILGVIGRNGAGKSTLLKILSRITEPTQGLVTMRGRVGSLLEVGTGFHPELSGRENIYLNGTIMGMKRTEINEKFDEIVEFAEIQQFLDTPVKHYSSGMYMRLAFSIAAHLEPEILLVDEVLAVGDASFQKKSIGKMGDVARTGRTVVVVSHNMLSIQGLCSTAIWLHAGKIVERGTPAQVITKYLHTSFSNQTRKCWDDVSTAPGNEEVRLSEASLWPIDGMHTDPISVDDSFIMQFAIYNRKDNARLNLNVQLFNEKDILVFETAPVHETGWLRRPFPAGLFRFRCTVPANLLNSGLHRVVLFVTKNDDIILHKEEDILMFEIVDTIENRAGWYGSWEGVVRPILAWETELVDMDLEKASVDPIG